MSHSSESPFLKIGITLHCLREEGNFPELRLRLKMWARGSAMAFPTNLTIFVEIPCTSQLSLGANDLMTLITCSGVVLVRLRLGKT